jgi:LysR family hca operon transcriptional activator
MLFRQRWHLELRHLRYFVAVAEARSLRLAAEEKLHTTQPSLSRQIRDLEDEVGAPLFVRGAKGVFLDHARVMLSQAEAAVQSARQIASPTKPSFALGFMIGHDTTWLPEALTLLRDELPNVHVVISTQNSPQLAAALLHAGSERPQTRLSGSGAHAEKRQLHSARRRCLSAL